MNNNELIDFFKIPNLYSVVDTFWLFKRIMKDDFFSAHIMIRILAIKNYYHENSNGWELYNKMQNERVASNPLVPKYMADHQEDFKKLIKSFEKNGYDYNYPIVINKDYMIIDGAHRLACCIYFGIEKVPVIITPKSYYDEVRDYSFNWFKKHNLNDCIEPGMNEYKSIEKKWSNK